ncbi:[FeFe] hydrogenase H-cluster radical SAM maturase HydE [Endomicrobiia bacterium]|nr:[FeFe] hydrogenase H-cluster radical SAM maturase HydE [Endomicrobiia bacterium]GHT70193.1 [FeFe] hydrogenase H-cluster radical SAM maturase HydE [Endomicrobiia bacterium]GHT74471.1 [FeFe] hydrogenase H-cluster radical SAM maturase HydE [Endomicrobiia bacterium]
MRNDKEFEYILNKAVQSHTLDEREILYLLETKNNKQLFDQADKTRKKYVGDEVHLRALIEFSNYCRQNCVYCGLRRDNSQLTRYRIEPNDIIELAKKTKNYGYKTIVLQSGEDPYYTVEKMTKIISEIKYLDIVLTLSIGEKTFKEYKAYRDAGADRYLLRIETTDEFLYNKLDPAMSLKNRMQCIEDIKQLGYEVGSGIIAGLPGQTLKSIARDITYLKSIPVDMAGIGPFIYHPNTPAENIKGNFFELSLKVMAVLRLLMPDINIPATTAMETLNPHGRLVALQSGANVVMPNATETIYRKYYEIYPGKICLGDSPAHCRFCIENKIQSINRYISKGKGFHIRQN